MSDFATRFANGLLSIQRAILPKKEAAKETPKAANSDPIPMTNQQRVDALGTTNLKQSAITGQTIFAGYFTNDATKAKTACINEGQNSGYHPEEINTIPVKDGFLCQRNPYDQG